MSRFVLSGYFGFKNFGDEAILSVLVNRLKRFNHEVTVISSDIDYTKGKFDGVSSVYTFDLKSIFLSIFSSDYLISGGGSLLQDVTSLKSLLYYLFVIFVGLILGKKTIIFAQGIGPINNFLGRILTKILLSKCVYVSVRDYKSFELLKSWGIDVELLCDPVFSVSVPEVTKKNVLAVQLRDFKTLTEDFIDRLAHKVVSSFPNYEYEIYSFQDTLDLDVCTRFKNSVSYLNPKAKVTLYSGLSDAEIIYNLSQVEYLIAMRFHALIVALCANVKLLGINYDVKVEKLANEFNFPLLNLKGEFNNEFDQLKSEDLLVLQTQVHLKKFNWTTFDSVCGNKISDLASNE